MAKREFKFQQDLKKTQNTFSDDPKLNRAHQIRRDNDNIKTPSVTLENIDENVITFINNTIQPYIIENGGIVPVTAMYASPEKWASIQRYGYLRDDKQKLMTPIIVVKRESMSARQDLPKNKVLKGQGNTITVKKKFTSKNQYDQFSILHDQEPISEYYDMEVPDYMDIQYTMIVWCDLVSQVNKVTEVFTHWLGQAWGSTYKFMTKADGFSFETSNEPGQDRVTKATINFTLKGYLLPQEIGKQENMMKSYSPKKIVYDIVMSEFSETSTNATGRSLSKGPTGGNVIVNGGGGGTLSNADQDEINTYMLTKIEKTANPTNTTTTTFTNVNELAAPATLDVSNVQKWFIFVNGQYIDWNRHVTSFTESGNDMILVLDTNELGYDLTTDMEVTVIGKFEEI